MADAVFVWVVGRLVGGDHLVVSLQQPRLSAKRSPDFFISAHAWLWSFPSTADYVPDILAMQIPIALFLEPVFRIPGATFTISVTLLH